MDNDDRYQAALIQWQINGVLEYSGKYKKELERQKAIDNFNKSAYLDELVMEVTSGKKRR